MYLFKEQKKITRKVNRSKIKITAGVIALDLSNKVGGPSYDFFIMYKNLKRQDTDSNL